MSKNKYEFDFFKELELPRPVTCGLVNKVTKPKGKRTLVEGMTKHDEPYYYYELHHDLVQIYDHDEEAALEAGLYWVMDIYRYKKEMHWNHYLVVLEGDGTVYPIAEYLDCHDSSWVKKAVKVVESYYNKEEIDPIGITILKADKPNKNVIKG